MTPATRDEAARDDMALLEWTRRRMLGRAAWVATTAALGGTALGALAMPSLGPAGLGLGLVVGLGALRAATGAFRFDYRVLVLDRLLRRHAPGLSLDPEGRPAEAALRACPLLAPLGAVRPGEGLAMGRLGGWVVTLAELRLPGGWAYWAEARPAEGGPARALAAPGLAVASVGEVLYLLGPARADDPPSLWRPMRDEAALVARAEALAALVGALA